MHVRYLVMTVCVCVATAAHLIITACAVIEIIVRVAHTSRGLEEDYVGNLVPSVLEPRQTKAIRSYLCTAQCRRAHVAAIRNY